MTTGMGFRHEPTVSVAMCVSNSERFVEEQLASIGRQTRPPDELVISDEGSTDGTHAIIDSFARSVAFPVRLAVNERWVGATKNFERALARCTGDLIAMADHDDVWHPEKLALEVEALRSGRLGGVFHDADVVGTDTQPLGYRLWDSAEFTARDRELMRNGRGTEVLLRKDVVTGSTMMFASRYRELVLPVPEGWIHDAWIALVLAAKGRLGFIERPLMKYRQHGANEIGAILPLRGAAGVRDRLSPDRLADTDVFASGVERYRGGSLRILALAPHGIDVDLAVAMERKAAHLEERRALPPGRVGRFAMVARELFGGGYHRYSAGLRSAGKDLLLRP